MAAIKENKLGYIGLDSEDILTPGMRNLGHETI